MESRRVGPAAYREENLKVPVLLFELVNRLEIPIQILATIIPRIIGVMDLLVGPGIREEDFPSIGFQISKSVQYMPVKCLERNG